jgi:hypothetical protein
VLTFTPTAEQNGQNFVVQVIATDDGTPVRSFSQNLLVTVPPLPKPPVIGLDLAQTIRNYPVTLSRLMSNDSDPQGFPLTFVSVDATSQAGGTITRAGTLVTYTPPTNFTGPDQFRYRVRNDAELTSEGIVQMQVRPLANFRLDIDSVTLLPGGALQIQVIDAPAYPFGISVSTNLIDWLPYGVATPGANGIMTYVDPLAGGEFELFYQFTADSGPQAGPLRLQSVRLQGGGVDLLYTGAAPLLPVDFEASVNLRDWSFFGTFTADANGMLLVKDSGLGIRRFYRPQ